MQRGASILSVGKNGLDLGDAGGILSLLFLSGIVLGVLGKVAKGARFLDVLDDLLALIALTPGELLHELLAAFGCQYDLACIHAHKLLASHVWQIRHPYTEKTGWP